MKAVQEVTQWDMESQPNHTYLLDGDKILAYIPNGSTIPTYFNRPLKIDQRKRKFTELKSNPFDTKIKSTLVEVKGSKGNSYWVDPDKGTCSCPAFKFGKGSCKHVQEVLQ
jgi:hypothetical protein